MIKISTYKTTETTFEIRKYPDPVLKKISEPVRIFDDELKNFVRDLFATMRANDGVGLAAPQVGVLKKIAVVEYDNKSFVLINPEVIEQKGSQNSEEGCLSFPGIYANVIRPQWVRIKALNELGETQSIDADDFLARAFLHEIDHLNGKLFMDYLSNLKKNAIKKKISKKTGGHF